MKHRDNVTCTCNCYSAEIPCTPARCGRHYPTSRYWFFQQPSWNSDSANQEEWGEEQVAALPTCPVRLTEHTFWHFVLSLHRHPPTAAMQCCGSSRDVQSAYTGMRLRVITVLHCDTRCEHLWDFTDRRIVFPYLRFGISYRSHLARVKQSQE